MRSPKNKCPRAQARVLFAARAVVDAPEEDCRLSAEFEVYDGEGEADRRGADGGDSQAFEDGASDGLERGRLRAVPGRGEVVR
jgi:hypothetical protein